MKKEEIMDILQDLKGEIRKKYRAEVIGIFGSYVRGEEGQESDIDVLVEFEKGASLLHLCGLSIFLEERLGIPVDVVPHDAIREEIRPYILKEVTYL